MAYTKDYLHDIQFAIDEDLRAISIPSKGVVLGVVGDKNTNRVNFLSEVNLIDEFERFISPCSETLIKKDLVQYPSIPSSSTDHKEQITRFIVDRLKYVDLMIMNGSTTLMLREDFSPNGESWVDEVSVDMKSGQAIIAEIDSVGPGEKENILSIGDSISDWDRDRTILHMYTTKTGEDNEVELFVNVMGNNDAYMGSIVTTLPLTIGLNKNGLYVNNNLYTPTEEEDTYDERMEQLINLTNIQVGSLEGESRSTAHYSYVKVE